MDQNITAIVPIKKHSERLPRKNFRDFNGRPLYHWILKTLENTPEISNIVVNTDADKIITNAPDMFDVDVSERPQELRGDLVGSRIYEYEINRNNSDIYLLTHCTNPLLKSSTISKAINKYIQNESSDSLFAVTRHQKMLYDQDLEPINHDPQNIVRTQDLPPIYEDNSNIYLFTEESFERAGGRIGESPMIFEMNEIESIDIDYREDFEMAEYFHRKRNSEKEA
jgi:N-acylneuraminate cytidylyltransferase